MSDSGIEIAARRLYEFMAEMHEWETKYSALYKQEPGGAEKYGDSATSEVLEIYSRFLTQKDRKTGAASGASVGYPPKFDPSREKTVCVEEPKKKKLIFETIWSHPDVNDLVERRRYHMEFNDGHWLLDHRETYSNYKSRWEKKVL